MSWPGARKVLAPAGEAVTFGEAGAFAGADADPLGAALAGAAELAGALAGLDAAAAAELLEELQAVTSKAAQAIPAQPATRRALRAFVLNMEIPPLSNKRPIAAR